MFKGVWYTSRRLQTWQRYYSRPSLSAEVAGDGLARQAAFELVLWQHQLPGFPKPLPARGNIPKLLGILPLSYLQVTGVYWETSKACAPEACWWITRDGHPAMDSRIVRASPASKLLLLQVDWQGWNTFSRSFSVLGINMDASVQDVTLQEQEFPPQLTQNGLSGKGI